MLSRPMQSGAVVNRVIELLRKHFKMFVLIGLTPIVVEILLIVPCAVFFAYAAHAQGLDAAGTPTPAFSVVMVQLMIPLAVVLMAVFSLFETAASWAALRVDAGAEASARQAWQVAWQQPGRSAWLMVLRVVRYSGPMILGMLLMVLGTASVAAQHGDGETPALAFVLIPLAVVLMLGGMVLGLVLYVTDCLANSASVTENLTAWQSIRRSVELSRGARWRIFGAAFLLYLIAMAVMMLMEIVFAVVIAIGVGLSAVLHVGTGMGMLEIGVCGLIFVPVLLIAIAVMMVMQPLYQAVIYRDLRRLEPVKTSATHPGTGFTGPQFR
jgi:hypothetical protein